MKYKAYKQITFHKTWSEVKLIDVLRFNNDEDKNTEEINKAENSENEEEAAVGNEKMSK